MTDEPLRPQPAEEPRETQGTALSTLIAQLGRIDEQLLVLRARTAPGNESRLLPLAGWVLLLGLLGLLLHRMIGLDRELRQQQQARATLTHDLRESDKRARSDLARMHRELRELRTLPDRLSSELKLGTQRLAARDKLARRLGAREAELELLRKKLALAEDNRARLATRVLFLDQQNKALEFKNRLLTARGKVARLPVKAPAKQAPQLKPEQIARLLSRINRMLRVDGRKKLLQLVSARDYKQRRFHDVYLEQRTPEKRLLQRIWASTASLELHPEHRMLRIKLTRCKRWFAAGHPRKGQENRLPAFTLELYDVNVKSWKELASNSGNSGNWLHVR